MATLAITSAKESKKTNGLWSKYLAFADSQQSSRTLWFFVSLLVHAAVFLPLPIFLIGYFDAPVVVLAITMVCFFTNLIANMGGSGIRVTLSCLIASVLIHIATVLIVVLG